MPTKATPAPIRNQTIQPSMKIAIDLVAEVFRLTADSNSECFVKSSRSKVSLRFEDTFGPSDSGVENPATPDLAPVNGASLNCVEQAGHDFSKSFLYGFPQLEHGDGRLSKIFPPIQASREQNL